MATNVIEFRGFAGMAAEPSLEDRVTIRHAGHVAGAATTLARELGAFGLRAIIWNDLATLASPVDPQGRDLNATVFGSGAASSALWQCRETAMQSPLIRAARLECDPFLITSRSIRTRWANPLLDDISLDDFEKRTGLDAAIVVPVHLPFNQIAAAALTRIQGINCDLETKFESVADRFAPAVHRFIRGYVMVTRDDQYLPRECYLSPREVECLSWVARGKTDYEISIILGCSHAGVRYHLARAGAKLGAMNRAQSVFRAGQMGYLNA